MAMATQLSQASGFAFLFSLTITQKMQRKFSTTTINLTMTTSRRGNILESYPMMLWLARG
jgi:hypothetical protein